LPRRTPRLAINALGNRASDEAVEIHVKGLEHHYRDPLTDGQRVPKGQVLVELDSAQSRAISPPPRPPAPKSASQVKRSRELTRHAVISRSQFEQLEAT